MTSHQGRKAKADHEAVAATCRNRPGSWVYVNTYAAQYVAKSMATHIQRGKGYPRIIAYHPIGHFEGRIQVAEDGWQVWARYNESR